MTLAYRLPVLSPEMVSRAVAYDYNGDGLSRGGV